MREELASILKGYAPAEPLATLVDRLAAGDDGAYSPYGAVSEGIRALSLTMPRPPVSVLPLGAGPRGPVVLDLSGAAVERRAHWALAWDGDAFAYLGSWELTPEAGWVWRPGGADPATLDAMVEQARAATDPQERASRLSLALLRPMYTEGTRGALAWAQATLLELGQAAGVDPHALRLAKAGRDGEAWRTVAAERAIAGRVREGLAGLEGALWLGCDTTTAHRIAERLYNRMGWGFNTRLLRLHAARN
jgi:hypothetical protein